ncbi:MAG: ribulokinase [Bacillota bacterium]|nr:ribulokinase [Bacillota bacterium]
MKKYSIGIDYGTLSGRAVLVDLATGDEVVSSVFEYPHAVMDEQLPSGKKLPDNYALQHPQDYLDVLKNTIPDILNKSGATPEEIAGIGIDFTACTVLPVYADGTPLCFNDKYKDEPHAYVKLWKHHAAQKQAEIIYEKAKEQNESWLKRYGDQISSEWFFPKILQVLEENIELYHETARFIEAGDWITWVLTGKETHSSCLAGYKAFWSKKDGYPSNDFFASVNPELGEIIGTKVSENVISVGSKAGELCEAGATLTGLTQGIAVASPSIDAHAALPATGITDSGKMLMIMGTSTCHIIMGDSEKCVPGISGVVEDGVCEGYFGYEAGQSCVGDSFEWYTKSCLPKSYYDEAAAQNINIHKLLREKAKKLKVGESGLVALDWWNGNRSILSDSDLTGLILGFKLTTKPEEIYRALIESTAYGTKVIIDNYEENGINIIEIFAAGGIAEKDEMTMQIYSDVMNKEIRISASSQSCALGSAMFGAVAGGAFGNIKEAASIMARVKDVLYKPIPENVRLYEKLYNEYKILHDYFGKGGNDIMKRLKEIK